MDGKKCFRDNWMEANRKKTVPKATLTRHNLPIKVFRILSWLKSSELFHNYIFSSFYWFIFSLLSRLEHNLGPISVQLLHFSWSIWKVPNAKPPTTGYFINLEQFIFCVSAVFWFFPEGLEPPFFSLREKIGQNKIKTNFHQSTVLLRRKSHGNSNLQQGIE